MSKASRPIIEQELARLAADLPDVRWIYLLNSHGIVRAVFPHQAQDADRVSAMAAAAQALGERIVKELKAGELRYALLSGNLDAILVCTLSPDDVLALGFRPNTSLDALFQALRQNTPALLQTLGIAPPPAWLAP